jgi:hypothetical protein
MRITPITFITPTTELHGHEAGGHGGVGPVMTLQQASTGRSVDLPGAVLEARFRAGDGFLVFLTEDTPFEEALHIHLLDSALRLQDSLELSAPYTPGVLTNLSVTGANELSFAFFGATDLWRLSVLAQPTRLLWGHRPPVRRARPLLRKTWLRLVAVS